MFHAYEMTDVHNLISSLSMYKFFQEKFTSVHLSANENSSHSFVILTPQTDITTINAHSLFNDTSNSIPSEVTEANICWYGCPFSYLHYMRAQNSKM